MEDRHGIVTAVLLIVCDLVCGQAEDELIFGPCFLHNLHVGAVHGCDQGASVHHHLLTACAGRFETCAAELFRQIGRRKDHFSIGHPIVFDEDDLDPPFDGRVVIDHLCYGIDQFDDPFCHIVSFGRLAPDDKGPGKKASVLRVLPDPVIAVNDVEDKEHGPLELVNSLDLNVIDGVRVNFHAVFCQNIFCQTDFVAVSDLHELHPGFLIICVSSHFPDPGEIRDPVRADMPCDPTGQQAVPLQKKAAVSDSVRFVAELVRHDLIKVAEESGLQDFRMDLRNTVHGEGGDKAEVSHPDLLVMDDPHSVHPVGIKGIHFLYFIGEAKVNLLDDLVNPGQKTGENRDRPPLHCFAEDSMVCCG